MSPADKLAAAELFGSSSEEEEEVANDEEASHFFDLLSAGARVPRGLSLHRRALDSETTRTLFDVLSNELREEGDDTEGRARGGRQRFYFGGLPPWALALSARVASSSSAALPLPWPRELAGREPLFDMVAVNSYDSRRKKKRRRRASKKEGGGEGEEEEEEDDDEDEEEKNETENENDDGLKQHVDLPRFVDGVAIFSLGADAVMRFEEQVAERGNAAGALLPEEEEEEEKARAKGGVVSCLLRDGDLLLLSREARWKWTHGFESGDHHFRGKRVERKGVRIGVTLRKMNKEEEEE